MNRRDSLGDRMKGYYESRTRFFLPRRTYTLIRVDGRAFHTYTRDCERPYDLGLMADMDAAAVALCERMDGARMAFVQSDEISVLLTDFATPQMEAWFDNNLQKLCSLSAAIATAHFNQARLARLAEGRQLLNIEAITPACFDSRVWTIPERGEVANYFLWRQQGATRNSISMTAQACLSHDRLQNKSSDAMQEMLFQEHGINWNDQPAGFKRGRVVERVRLVKDVEYDVEYVDGRTGETRRQEGVERHEWRVVEPPVFSQGRDWLLARIPEPPPEL